jgi:HK97 family phage major capsid protein
VLAHARAGYSPDRDPVRVVRQLWPRDEEALRLVTRAATSFATTTTAGWSAELGQHVISELLVSLGPISAGSELLRRSNMLSLERHQSVQVPALVASATLAAFVSEGQPIPIRQLDTSKSIKLEPRKLATGFVLTRELISSSNAEALVGLVIRNSLSLSLDAVLFSTTAGTAAAPPGLLAGITPLTAATGISTSCGRR